MHLLRRCADRLLGNVCPNCGGGFVPRPIRPASKLAKHPATSTVTSMQVDLAAHAERVAAIGGTPPERR